MISFKEFIKESPVSGVFYHGSGNDFDKFEQSASRSKNDLFGGGVAYFTDNIDVARSYSTNAARRRDSLDQTKILYTVRLNLKKAFDTTVKELDSKLVSQLIPDKPSEQDHFGRDLKVYKGDVNRHNFIFKIKSGEVKVSGEALWNAISSRGTNTVKGRNTLKSSGFDGLIYEGGHITRQVKHKVVIPYNPSSIKIINKEEI